ncbi:DUF7344 domain-containing protein [Natronococcus occultus]|uniref:DUF7344 domain-containing protein n=1 Tax=Natronococcus occultus SP4 TaxID=694430 RepID=L0JXA4_9EURY|nr:hypothetical protein [Natronococcus occultus]AGB36488.1 hypothetical protein Natoc_0628 [Natronococcus occultus SP4]
MSVSKLDEEELEPEELNRDEVFEMLSNQRRRWVLHYLKQQNEDRVDLRSLVDSVSSWEYETPADELPWKKRKRVYTSLRQSHLPRLDESGVIEYDRNRGEVALTNEARKLQLYLEYVPEDDIPWSHCYLGLSGVSAAITALAWYPVYPIGELSAVALGALVTAMFGLSAVVHTYHSRRNRIGHQGPPKR